MSKPRLRKKGIVLIIIIVLKKISSRILAVSDIFTEEERTPDDIYSVAMSTGYRANDSLYHALKGQVGELYAMGNCHSPRHGLDAIHKGHSARFDI